jgi:hypothetical protein
MFFVSIDWPLRQVDSKSKKFSEQMNWLCSFILPVSTPQVQFELHKIPRGGWFLTWWWSSVTLRGCLAPGQTLPRHMHPCHKTVKWVWPSQRPPLAVARHSLAWRSVAGVQTAPKLWAWAGCAVFCSAWNQRSLWVLSPGYLVWLSNQALYFYFYINVCHDAIFVKLWLRV